jgi:hypothetical protein
MRAGFDLPYPRVVTKSVRRMKARVTQTRISCFRKILTPPFPIITVDDREVSDVRVKLGAKGGILEGTLVDRMTGSPIEKGKVIIADARSPAIFMEVFANKEGRFQFVVPNKAIRISASAPGYPVVVSGDWITLAGGEHRNITIELSASAEPGGPR